MDETNNWGKVNFYEASDFFYKIIIINLTSVNDDFSSSNSLYELFILYLTSSDKLSCITLHN